MTKTLMDLISRVAPAFGAGLLVAILFAGSTGGFAPANASPSHPRSLRAIDFNDPVTLARWIERGSMPDRALHDVVCTNVERHNFSCRGFATDGTDYEERVHVSADGSSWNSR
jgi:hypothetical protein